MEKHKVECMDCGAQFTEIYPDGLEGSESYSDPADPKPCDCESSYFLLDAAGEDALKMPRVLIIVGDEGEVNFKADAGVSVEYWERGRGEPPPEDYRDLAEAWSGDEAE